MVDNNFRKLIKELKHVENTGGCCSTQRISILLSNLMNEKLGGNPITMIKKIAAKIQDEHFTLKGANCLPRS